MKRRLFMGTLGASALTGAASLTASAQERFVIPQRQGNSLIHPTETNGIKVWKPTAEEIAEIMTRENQETLGFNQERSLVTPADCPPLLEWVGVSGNLGKNTPVREYVVRQSAFVPGSPGYVDGGTRQHVFEQPAGYRSYLGSGNIPVGLKTQYQIRPKWRLFNFWMDNFSVNTQEECYPRGGSFHGQAVFASDLLGNCITPRELWCEPEGFEISAKGRTVAFGSAAHRWNGGDLKFMGPEVWAVETWGGPMLIIFNALCPTRRGFIWMPFSFQTAGTSMLFTLGKLRVDFQDNEFMAPPDCG